MQEQLQHQLEILLPFYLVNPDLLKTGYPEVYTEYTGTISGLGALL